MRGFAQMIFNALLGWIRMLVEGVWDLFFSNEAQQWFVWVADNWLVLVVFLCLCGVAMDYIIWLFRWRPYYVWASSFRRMRRFFGGKEPMVAEQPRQSAGPVPAPHMDYPQEMTYDSAGGGDMFEAQSWEEQIWEEQSWEQPQEQPQEPAWMDAPAPAVTSDTILARPRKADYQEQYIRRFQRPEAEVPAPPAWREESIEDWSAPQADTTMDAGNIQEELWAPEATDLDTDQPIHPGIDYQALSRQYGWHQEQPSLASQALETSVEQPRESSGFKWDFSGLENFSPYRAPAPPTVREQRSERARKARSETTPLSKVKYKLGRIAQKASKVLTVDDEDAGKLIDGLPPPIDKRRAFHAPVYPNRPGSNQPQSPDFQEDD